MKPLDRRRILTVCGGLAAALAAVGVSATSDVAPALVGPALARPAVATAQAARSVLQGAARAGTRLVAVGERGIVVVSDDQGGTWRQVPTPVSVGLTAVRFVDARHGWAVGHGGVVLFTTDGGDHWARQFDGLQAARLVLEEAKASGDERARADAERLVADGADKPLLDLHFFDPKHGLVLGAYNLAFETLDGGRSWQPITRTMDNPRGLHLYAVRARGDEVVVVGEQGLVLRSTDRGRHFSRLALPYKGSFFTAELPAAHEIVVAGLRGNVWRSGDDGASWAQVPNPVPVSVTASGQDAEGRVWLGNQAGMVFSYTGDAVLPTPAKSPPLTGLLPLAPGRLLALSVAGAHTLNLGASK